MSYEFLSAIPAIIFASLLLLGSPFVSSGISAATESNYQNISDVVSDSSNSTLSTIKGVVYNDTNGNSRLDNETAIANWNVTITNGDNVLSSTLTGSGDLGYSFSNLEPGSYTVFLNIPTPYVPTQPNENHYVVNVTGEDANDTIKRDFGVYKIFYRLIDKVSFNSDIQGFTVEGLSFGNDGYLYHIDIPNKVVNKFDKNGTLMSSFGQSVLQTPSGIAVDSSGYIFVAEKFGNIKVFDSNGTLQKSFNNTGNGSGQYDLPRGLTLDSEDNLYITDGGSHRIQKFDREGNYLATIGSTISKEMTAELPNYRRIDAPLPWSYLHLPFDVEIDSKGNVFVADTVNNRIQKFDANGKFLLNIGRSADEPGRFEEGQFNKPRAIAIGLDDSVYVADTYYHRIQLFDNDGKFIRAFGSLGSEPGQFSNPSGLAIDVDTGNIYVADSGNKRIQIFDRSGEFLSEFSTGLAPMEPYFSFAHDGYLLVSDNAKHTVYKFDLNDGTYLDEFGGVGSEQGKFRGPRGIAVSSDNSIWVADNYNNRIQKFDAEGNSLMTVGKLGFDEGEFRQPRGLVIDSDDNILVADTQNNRIQKFDAEGNFITSFTTPAMLHPYQIALDSQGNIYVAEGGSKSIEKLDSSGQSLMVIGGNGTGAGKFVEPRGVYVDSEGYIYTTDQSNRIQKFDAEGKLVMELGQWGSDPGEFFNPRGILVDQSGNILVNDTQNERIQIFDREGSFVREITYIP